MITVLQRVQHAKVEIDGQTVGATEQGLLILLGVAEGDTRVEADKLVKKIANLRIFEDENGKMNLSLLDIGGGVLVVTLEPCAMCAGAILNARIPRVVYGASDRKFGACQSVCSLFSMDFNHHPQVEAGLLAEESQALLQEFFKELRVTLGSRPKWKPKTPI